MKQITCSPSEFAERYSTTKRNLKLFCKLVYDAVIKSVQGCGWKHPPKLRIIDLPIKNNGIVHFVFAKKLSRFTVVINIHHILRAKDCSNQMKFFYLYATIIHELEHIRLLYLLNQKTVPTYFKVVAAWDQFYHRRGTEIDAATRFLIPKKHRVSDKRSIASPAETYCNLQGFVRAYDVLNNNLTMDEKQIVCQMIDSLEMITKSLEIGYDSRGRAVGLFVSTIQKMRTFRRYSKKAATHFPVIDLLLNAEGMLISAAEMMSKTQLPDKCFYDAILIRMFIYWDCDWNKLFERTEGLKTLISELANEYCQQCLCYLMNQETARVFMPEEIIQDNAAMLIKSIHVIKRKMKQYGMQNTVGGVFPMYGI